MNELLLINGEILRATADAVRKYCTDTANSSKVLTFSPNIKDSQGKLIREAVECKYIEFVDYNNEDYNELRDGAESYAETIVDYGFLPNNLGVSTPVLYDTNIGNEEEEDSGYKDPDFEQPYFYQGTEEIDGHIYDKWRRIECTGQDNTFTWASTAKKYIYTNQIIIETIGILPSDFPNKIDEVYEKGRSDGYDSGADAEYDAFWDKYLNNGNRTVYNYGAFGGNGWTDETFRPTYKIKPLEGYGMFQGCMITEITDVDFSEISTFNNTFAYSPKLQRVGTVGNLKSTTFSYTFTSCRKLHTIDKIIVLKDATYSQTFKECINLENIEFDGEIGNDIDFQWSTKLTKASIESIINHLSDDVSGKTLMLSKTAADEAFPCWWDDPQTGATVNVGCNGSGEWNNLILSKPNWKITPV